MQNFRFSTPDVKFHQICTLISSFSAKKVQKIYVSWPWRLMNNLKKNWLVVPRMTKIWLFLTRVFKSFTNLRFDWFLLCKVFNVWPKKVQRIYLSWQWRVMQKFKEKLTCGLENNIKSLANCHQSTGKCQNWDFMTPFCPRQKMYELTIYSGIMCHDNEEWYKSWKGINLSF